MSCSHFTSCRRGPVPVSSPPRHQPHEPQQLEPSTRLGVGRSSQASARLPDTDTAMEVAGLQPSPTSSGSLGSGARTMATFLILRLRRSFARLYGVSAAATGAPEFRSTATQRPGNSRMTVDSGCCMLARRPIMLPLLHLSLIHISEPTRLGMISYA